MQDYWDGALAEDGRKLAAYDMDSIPVFDGMSAAGGGIYLSLIDGTVVKYGAVSE